MKFGVHFMNIQFGHFILIFNLQNPAAILEFGHIKMCLLNPFWYHYLEHKSLSISHNRDFDDNY